MFSSSTYYQKLKWQMLPIFRRRRMERFFGTMHPQPGSRILDVGGLPSLNGVPGFWEGYADCFKITLLNLPGSFGSFTSAQLRPYRMIEADACRCDLISDQFDIVFSNALVEHVGNFQRQMLLANFIRSAGHAYWVQTPSPFFPLEGHCDQPFWWLRSLHQRKRIISRWKRSKPFLAKQMAATRPIWPNQLRTLFPDSELATEYLLGLPKSQIAYRLASVAKVESNGCFEQARSF
ncbi:class I SAM-dependent methyltransferase [Bradyrhizobium guangdongense]